MDQKGGDLSGSNQQKVMLARWLVARCEALLFGEPTRGIDNGAEAEIFDLFGELVKQGITVLLISSEMSELMDLAERMAVMHEGRPQGVRDRTEAMQERTMELALRFTS